METLLYGELTPWYRLLDPVADHADEAALFQRLFAAAINGPARTLLELGAGAGNNASYLKAYFHCTLTDLSAGMRELSAALNPDCEHEAGDMRTLRLGRTFDAVLVHDAVMYLTTRDELAAAARTAFAHTRAGGAALFVPDCVREMFRESSELGGVDEGARGLRCLLWAHDPDPGDDTFVTDFAFLLRDGQTVRAVHDRHLEGLFPTAVWEELLTGAGFEVQTLQTPPEVDSAGLIFVCRRR